VSTPARAARLSRAPGVREWLYRQRDRLLASPRFQRAAARFPLTRPIARRRAGQLFDFSAGFVYSQILFACVRSGLLDALAAGPRPVAEVAREIRLPEEGALRLLRAAASLRLAQPCHGDCYRLGDLGAVMLGNPGIGAMVAHHERLYADLADPLALLAGRRETQMAGFWPYAGSDDREAIAADDVAPYSALMAESQALLADHILDACSLADRSHLLDVAGGEGVFLRAALARYPQLRGTVMDLPPVAARAADALQQAGLAQRASAVGADMFGDPWPGGADVISFVRVLHDHDDGPAQSLLERARASLRPGGRLLVAEPMARTRGAEPMGDGYFGMYLLAMGSGRPRPAAELKARIRRAGFAKCRELRSAQPMLVRVLLAEVDQEVVN
jgi:demethylspheroidene O-methyltransferase